MSDVVLDFEKLTQRVLVLERKVDDLQGAVLALQNMVSTPNDDKPTPAVTEGKLLADLDPELAQLVEVYDADGEIRVKCKKFIYQRNKWNEIHHYLTDRGLKWESRGKDSYWFKPTEEERRQQ